eukprot:scaffold1102_cov195-Alexandrium_tamarense.AAC.23
MKCQPSKPAKHDDEEEPSNRMIWQRRKMNKRVAVGQTRAGKQRYSCSRRAATVSLSFTLFSYCPDENSQDPSCSAVSVPGAAFNTSWNDPPPAVKWHPTRSKQEEERTHYCQNTIYC